MMQPWFDPNKYAWLPGTGLAVVAVLLALVVVWLVPQGRAKRPITQSWFGLWLVAVMLFIVGCVALVRGQPWGVWYGLMLPGIIGAFVLGGNMLIILKKYHDVESKQRQNYKNV